MTTREYVSFSVMTFGIGVIKAEGSQWSCQPYHIAHQGWIAARAAHIGPVKAKTFGFVLKNSVNRPQQLQPIVMSPQKGRKDLAHPLG